MNYAPSIPIPTNYRSLAVQHAGLVWTVASLARELGIDADWLYTVILCGASVRGIRYDFVKPAVRKAVRA